MIILTEEQREEWKKWKAGPEYKEYMDQMIIDKEPLTEDVLVPYLFSWFCEEKLGIDNKDAIVPKQEEREYNPEAVVYDDEQAFLKANPHIQPFVDNGYTEKIENKNLPILLNSDESS